MGWCGGDTEKYTDTPTYVDPLGPNKSGVMGTTGGPEARAKIFQYLQNLYPQTQAKVAGVEDATRKAASAPGFGQAANLASSTMRGDYLKGSPEINAAIDATRRKTGAEAADAGANLQDQFTRNGVSWTTANQEAQQANKAAAAARAGETEATSRGNVYAQERVAQNAAPTNYSSAVSTPLSYLQTIPGMQMTPMQNAASIVQGLAGGSTMATPNSAVVKQPGAADYTISAMGALGSW